MDNGGPVCQNMLEFESGDMEKGLYTHHRGV